LSTWQGSTGDDVTSPLKRPTGSNLLVHVA
jgi:hypothetical protein